LKAETREQFLDWAKKRALEYVDSGDLLGAYASMASDLGKNRAVYDRNHPGARTAIELGMLEIHRGPEAMRHWIEGFN
jgi:hypothetical protein